MDTMNDVASSLINRLISHFSSDTPRTFESIIKARLKGMKTGEDVSNLSSETADEIEIFIKKHSQRQLTEWCIAISLKKIGPIQSMLNDFHPGWGLGRRNRLSA